MRTTIRGIMIAALLAGWIWSQQPQPARTIDQTWPDIWNQLKKYFRFRTVRFRGKEALPVGRVVVQALDSSDPPAASASAELSSPVFEDDGRVFAFQPSSAAAPKAPATLMEITGSKAKSVGALPPNTFRLLAVDNNKAIVLATPPMQSGMELIEVSRPLGGSKTVILDGSAQGLSEVLDSLTADARVYESGMIESSNGEILIAGRGKVTACADRNKSCVQPALSKDTLSIAYLEIDRK